jgi:hypothetical protein
MFIAAQMLIRAEQRGTWKKAQTMAQLWHCVSTRYHPSVQAF